MAVQYWKDLSILVGSLEMAGHGKECTLKTDVEVLDTTPLSTTGYTTCIGGNKTGTIDLTFMSDMAVGTVPVESNDTILHSYLGLADVPKSFVTASADGSVAYLTRGVVLGYTPLEGAPGALAMGRLAGRSSTGPVVRGQLIHPASASRTASSTGAGQQHGAVASGKSLYAALHVISVAGSTPTLDVKVQSDDNSGFTTPTDRITFAQKTARSYEWSSVAGAITDDYWRVSYTIGGTGPSFSFAVTIGIV